MDTYLGLSPEGVALWWRMEWVCSCWLLLFPSRLARHKKLKQLFDKCGKQLFDKYGPASGAITYLRLCDQICLLGRNLNK